MACSTPSSTQGQGGVTEAALTLAQALAQWDRTAQLSFLQTAEEQRAQIRTLFPLESWAALPLQRYAIGTGEEGTFCWWLEFNSNNIGRMGGGNAGKLIIYKQHDG